MTARGHDARWFWQARPLATSAGAMFIRAYERGERIHHAMLARGFTGSMPLIDAPGVERTRWEMAAGFAGALWAVAVTAMVLA